MSEQSGRESVERFGDATKNLSGIMHLGQRSPFGKRQPVAVLMWNVGVFPRTGPNRQYVEIARQLARHGFDVLRFDLGGLGDSAPSTSTTLGLMREVEDIRAAIDHVEKAYGCHKVILVGFCSSALNGHACAVADERVAGVVLIDGYGYPTFKYFVLHYAKRFLSPLHWRHILQTRLRSLAPAAFRQSAPSYFREFAPREQVMAEIDLLLRRGVRCLFIYTQGLPTVYNYQDQFFDMFPALPRRDPRLAVRFFAGANHLFGSLRSSASYQAAICRWILASFGAGLAPASDLSR